MGRRRTSERSLTRDPDAHWSGRQERSTARGRGSGTGEGLPILARGGPCWCGEPHAEHPWPPLPELKEDADG